MEKVRINKQDQSFCIIQSRLEDSRKALVCFCYNKRIGRLKTFRDETN